MDAVATMGGLLPAEAWGRDAVHVAVFSAYSTEPLKPGQRVAILNEEGGKDMRVRSDGTHVGIVDPFLSAVVERGERFWVYLYPRTITALSHRWSHPAFEATASVYSPPSDKLRSEEWLRDFCAHNDCPEYESVLAKAARFIRSGDNGASWADNEYLHFNGQDAHASIPPEFWDHVETIIGQKAVGEKPKYFSCSC